MPNIYLNSPNIIVDGVSPRALFANVGRRGEACQKIYIDVLYNQKNKNDLVVGRQLAADRGVTQG